MKTGDLPAASARIGSDALSLEAMLGAVIWEGGLPEAQSALATVRPASADRPHEVQQYEAAPTKAAAQTHQLPGVMPTVFSFEPAVSSTPKDPLYTEQVATHFALIGGLEAVWQDYTGKGVAVGVYDSGIQTSHWDLSPNYDASKHVWVDGTELVPIDGRHGTSVAGLIAAARNGEGGVGIAYDAKLTSVDIFNPANPAFINEGFDNLGWHPAGFFQALDLMTNFDVVNHSWGAFPSYRTWQNLNVEDFSWNAAERFAAAARDGRDGLGTIGVKSAGNDNRDANGDGLNATRFTITVAAAGQDGFTSNWGGESRGSNYGANILVTAPGGGNGLPQPLTTDLLGAEGYGPGDYSAFNGTSAAAPIVTGVIALMLEANPGLGWRDVKNILAYSATETGSGFSDTPGRWENNAWFLNGASNWNNGGAHFSNDYGYGMVNAYNAVRMAEVWDLFGPAATSANEVTVSASREDAVAISSLGPVTYEIEVEDSLDIEAVSVTVDIIGRTLVADVRIFLEAPDGTAVEVGRLGESTTGVDITWTFGVEAFRGMDTSGLWTLEIVSPIAYGTLAGARLDFHGSAPSSTDVFHFTDEFMEMRNLPGQEHRAVLQEASGGTKWINMAAVTADVTLNLNNKATSSFDDVEAFQLAPGSTIRNAVTGDGNDTIIGSPGPDRLYGGRGDDHIDGGSGNDILVGGPGLNTLFGGRGSDIFRFYEASDAHGDKIMDFGRLDRIDLSRIDADMSSPGNQSFHFIGQTDFSTSARELRFAESKVQGDVTGNGQADFEILIANNFQLQEHHFIL